MTKHNWILDENGKADEWAWESGFHNGVICKDCGFSPCVHCDEDWFEMDDCPGPEVKKPMTNAARIRAMSDEELAKWLLRFVRNCGAVNGNSIEWADGMEEKMLDMLKQPAEE